MDGEHCVSIVSRQLTTTFAAVLSSGHGGTGAWVPRFVVCFRTSQLMLGQKGQKAGNQESQLEARNVNEVSKYAAKHLPEILKSTQALPVFHVRRSLRVLTLQCSTAKMPHVLGHTLCLISLLLWRFKSSGLFAGLQGRGLRLGPSKGQIAEALEGTSAQGESFGTGLLGRR